MVRVLLVLSIPWKFALISSALNLRVALVIALQQCCQNLLREMSRFFHPPGDNEGYYSFVTGSKISNVYCTPVCQARRIFKMTSSSWNCQLELDENRIALVKGLTGGSTEATETSKSRL